MNRTITIIALSVVAFAASNASAQTHDHFARQRQEAVARQAAAQHHFSHHGSSGHWGGVTTNQRYYHPSHGHGQNVQFYQVNPYGYGFGYGVPSYGFYGGGNSYYGSPYYAPGGSGIYIHREIYIDR